MPTSESVGDAADQYASFEMRGNVLVVHVKLEEIRDSATAYQFRDYVTARLGTQPAVHVVFDCGSLRFIGSVGFLAFLGVRRAQPTGRIVMCNMSTGIREMFQICRLLTKDDNDAVAPFDWTDSLDEALQKIGRR